jgi:hypothetical protein
MGEDAPKSVVHPIQPGTNSQGKEADRPSPTFVKTLLPGAPWRHDRGKDRERAIEPKAYITPESDARWPEDSALLSSPYAQLAAA